MATTESSALVNVIGKGDHQEFAIVMYAERMWSQIESLRVPSDHRKSTTCRYQEICFFDASEM